MGASAQLSATSVDVVPGGVASIDVTVKNTGKVVDELSLTVMGAAAAWTTVEPPTVSVFPGEDATVMVRFRPPLRPAPPAGELPFAVRVQCREDAKGGVAEEGVLQVAPAPALSVELAPRTTRGSRKARLNVAVDNLGNLPAEVQLESVAIDDQTRVAIDPPVLRVPPGTAAFARVTVTFSKPFVQGADQQRAIQLLATPGGGGEPLRIDGVVVQQGILPPAAKRALAMGAGALALLAVLWFTLLKPTIRSTAEEAVKPAEQMANAAQVKANIALTATGQLPPNGGGGTGGEGAGLQVAVSFLLSGDQAHRVPDGQHLNITDVVFGNPGNNHGIVRLRIAGRAVLELNLDNFRDLDYHFQTPLVANPGEEVRIEVQGCLPESGQGSCGDPRPSVMVSGLEG